MSITSSFYSALSGMDSNGIALQVIADNISNSHTVGFKGSTVHFEDILGMSLEGVGGANRLGVGATVSTIACNFTQGTMSTTGVGTDLALNGKGFFILEDPTSATQFYTRAGNFHMDSNGYLVSPNAQRVQGYLYDPAGINLIETLADIRVDQTDMIAPAVSSEVEITLNLDSEGTAKVFDIVNPGTTSNYSTALTIYDALGQAHTITVYFTKVAQQDWDWNALIDGSDVSGGVAGIPELFGTGGTEFTTSGLLSNTTPQSFHTEAITFANGIAAAIPMTVDFTGTTQYGAPSAVQSIHQDGYAAGIISGIAINQEGNVVGHYTNGIVRDIARLALADFPSVYGLERAGSMLFKATPASGDPLVNKPGEAGLGDISASMLEESNVDLAAEFIKMIITQRAYQANTKIISTTDEMLAQLLSIK